MAGIVDNDHLRSAQQMIQTCWSQKGIQEQIRPFIRGSIAGQQNAAANVIHQSMTAEVVADIQVISNAPDRATAEQYLQTLIQKYAKAAPRLSA